MPKVGMEQVRRRQMIAATKVCIHRDGIVRASASRIAREAGIAPALIMHYFDDKDALLVETFRSIYREFTTDIRRRLGLARTPQERMLSLLEAQISPSTLTPEAVTTWFAIYATMWEYPVLERIEHAYDRRLLSNLTHALRGMGLDAGEARDVAEELSVFIDGLWQNLANPVTFSTERARRLLYRYLHLRLPGFAFVPPPDETAARTADDHALSGEAKQFLKDNLPISPVRISSATVVELRAQLAQLSRPEAKAAAREFGLRLTQVQVGGIEALQIAPKSNLAGTPLVRIFYLFGGGYVTGDPESDLPISGSLAMRLSATVVSIRYRLAPEHPFPAALKDAVAAYRAFVAESAVPFVMVGESAGGGLALALLQAARREGLRMPSAVALLSPWVDLTHGMASSNDGFDPTFTRRNLMESARLYAGAGADLADPRLSPLFGDLTGMPPMVITTGSRDILREQALALGEALSAAGSNVELHDWPGLWHVFEFYRGLPEAALSLDRVVAFLRQHSPSALEQAS